jgi:Cys-tRNA(Pro)/Cys-tRNA(Cys) deacylase
MAAARDTPPNGRQQGFSGPAHNGDAGMVRKSYNIRNQDLTSPETSTINTNPANPFLQRKILMTPAINILKKKKIPHTIHSYQHDGDHPSYGLEAAEKLGLDPQQVFKTLVAELGDGSLVVAVIPVDRMLNMKLLAKAAGEKKADMADKRLVERTTGYVLGGVSPLGQKKQLRTFLDISAQDLKTIFVSAGRRGLEIEISPQDLLALTRGMTAAICQEA